VTRVCARLGTSGTGRRWWSSGGAAPRGAQKAGSGVLRFGTTDDTTKQTETETEARPLLRVIGVRISGVGPAPGARLQARERATSCPGVQQTPLIDNNGGAFYFRSRGGTTLEAMTPGVHFPNRSRNASG
jgi:hypothetical protein